MADSLRGSGISHRSWVLLLGGLAALGSLATQLLVPALPLVARDLGAGPADAQLVIGVFLMAMGAGQLACGPLADRLGRREVLLAGMVVFCAGSLMAALAPDFLVLLCGRALQALGAAAAIVTVRVILADLFPPDQVARAQATLMAVVLVSPTVAPVIGGQLAQWAGWRGVMGLLAAAGITGLLLAALVLPRPASSPAPPRPRLHAAYRELLQNRRFLTGSAAMACGSAGLYMFLGFAPFLLQHDHGLSPRDTGLALMLVAMASIAGTRLVHVIEQRGDALLAGAVTALAGAAFLALFVWTGATSLAAFLGPVMLIGIAAGLTGPTGISRVLLARPGLEATATSLAGALQMATSAAASWLLGHAGPMGLALLATGMLPVACCGLIAAVLSRPNRSPENS